MIEGINIVAVLGTTCFMMASATVWYSPMMFGKRWLKEMNVTEDEVERSRQNIFTHLTLLGIAYAVVLTTISFLIYHFNSANLQLIHLGVAFAAIPVAVLGNTTLLENRSRVYFLINAGFCVYFVIVGTFMLSYWPW